MDKQQIEAIRKRMPSYDRPGKSELLTPYGTAMQDATALLKAYDALAAAARAVVDRWDTPLWKDAEHPAEVINRLRRVLEGER